MFFVDSSRRLRKYISGVCLVAILDLECRNFSAQSFSKLRVTVRSLERVFETLRTRDRSFVMSQREAGGGGGEGALVLKKV